MNTVQALKKGGEYTIEIEAMSFGGQGVGRVDDFVVFVDGAVPGDMARVRITRKKKSFAEGRRLDILRPSPHRAQPVCKYFGLCGGCRMQDVQYDAQLEFKRRNVEDAFRRLGGFHDLAVPTPIGSPEQFHYRNKMEFSFGDRPWLSDYFPVSHASFALGMHIPKRFDKVLDIDSCHLHPPAWNEIINSVRSFAIASGLPPYSVRTNDGFWRFLVLRRSHHTGELMVKIITGADHPETLNDLKNTLVDRFPQLTSFIHGVSGRTAQVAVSEREYVLHGPDRMVEHIGSLRFEISSDAFFQTNSLGAEVLYNQTLRLARLTGDEELLDLYCGTGTIALFLASHAKKVTGFELVESAVQNANRNAILNRINNATFFAGDLRHVLKQNPMRADIVVLDPPRAGLHNDVIAEVISLNPRVIVYVSCNPATQARDAALFAQSGYLLTEIQPVDLFPHTYHIENIIRLERIHAG